MLGRELQHCSLPMDNWAERTLSGECYETIGRITRAFWFFGIALDFLRDGITVRRAPSFQTGKKSLQSGGQRKILFRRK